MVKHFAQTGKKRFCLTNERNSTILILTGAPSPSGKAGDFDSIPKGGCIISDLYEAFKIVGDSMILKAFFFSKFNRKICCAGQKEIF